MSAQSGTDISLCIGTQQPISSGRALSIHQDLGIKLAAQAGALLGQLFFGWLADKVGRKRMCTCCSKLNTH